MALDLGERPILWGKQMNQQQSKTECHNRGEQGTMGGQRGLGRGEGARDLLTLEE